MQQAHTFHDIRADIYKPTSQRSNLTAKMKDMTASGRIIKQGFLTKQALKSKRNWKQRWCVLQVRMVAHSLLLLSRMWFVEKRETHALIPLLRTLSIPLQWRYSVRDQI